MTLGLGRQDVKGERIREIGVLTGVLLNIQVFGVLPVLTGD